ncbi:hypothetical protein D3C72_1543530 [compost metagenome]
MNVVCIRLAPRLREASSMRRSMLLNATSMVTTPYGTTMITWAITTPVRVS